MKKIIIVLFLAGLGLMIFGPFGAIIGAIAGLAAAIPRGPGKPVRASRRAPAHRVGGAISAALARALRVSGDL